MTAKPQSTVLPIAFKATDRQLLQAAAERLGLAESTYVRQMAVAAARGYLESYEAPAPPPSGTGKES